MPLDIRLLTFYLQEGSSMSFGDLVEELLNISLCFMLLHGSTVRMAKNIE